MSVVACQHWIGSDATGRMCDAVVVEGALPYCSKHREIQRRRAVKEAEKRRAQRARADAAWMERNGYRLGSWRTQLERAEAEYERRTSSPVNDRAAYGGASHPSIRRQQLASFSDTNVARVGELSRIIERLRADIARAEGLLS